MFPHAHLCIATRKSLKGLAFLKKFKGLIFLLKSLSLSLSLITLFNTQLLFGGPSKYNNRMFKKLRKETLIQIELQTPTIMLWGPMSLSNIMLHEKM